MYTAYFVSSTWTSDCIVETESHDSSFSVSTLASFAKYNEVVDLNFTRSPRENIQLFYSCTRNVKYHSTLEMTEANKSNVDHINSQNERVLNTYT